MEDRIKVLIATTEPLLADGIVNAIMATEDLEVVGRTKNRTEAMALIRELRPQVAIIDCDLLEADCLQVLTEMRQGNTNLAVLALIGKAVPSRLLQHLQAGVAGYLPKTATGEELVSAIRRVYTGEAVLTLPSVQELIEQLNHDTGAPGETGKEQPLSPKELEVLKLASEGLTNKKIALKLFISERTVQSHFSAIFGKLGVGSRTEAVSVAWRNGWIGGGGVVD